MKMNKQLKKIYLLMSVVLLAGASACKKNGADEGGDTSTAFAGKKWTVQRMELTPAIDLDGDGHADSDMMAFSEPCRLDDITIFKSDGSIVVNEGNLRCEEDDAQEYVSGTWSYDSSSKQLTISERGEEPSVVEVLEANDQQLRLKQSTQTGDGTVFSVTITFKRS